MLQCVLISLLEIKSFVSLKIDSLLFRTSKGGAGGGGGGGGGGGWSDRYIIFWVGLGKMG